MNAAWSLVLGMLAAHAQTAPLQVITNGGDACVSAAALEREVGIVIKRLPGSRGAFVACSPERCAPMNSVIDGEALLVPITPLSEAMNLRASFDESRRYVTFTPAPSASPTNHALARVGSIAPNLRLTKLHGGSISLDELRGQRVLINSWASW